MSSQELIGPIIVLCITIVFLYSLYQWFKNASNTSKNTSNASKNTSKNESSSNVNHIIIDTARKAYMEGNYKGSIALLEPLLKGEKKKTLSPEQERIVVGLLSNVFRFFDDNKSALPHARRRLELSIQLNGKVSDEHASALESMGLAEAELKDFKSA